MVRPFDVSKFRSGLTKSIQGISTGFESDPDTWISTGNYTLNYLISGDFNKGVPLGRVTMFAGESGSGKSLIASGNLIKNAQNDNVDILSINTDNARLRSEVKKYLRDKSYPFITLSDINARYLKKIGGDNMPYLLLVDTSGIIVREYVGYNIGDEIQYKNDLEQLLDGSLERDTLNEKTLLDQRLKLLDHPFINRNKHPDKSLIISNKKKISIGYQFGFYRDTETIEAVEDSLVIESSYKKELELIFTFKEKYDLSFNISNINNSKENFIEISEEFIYVINKAISYCSLVNGSYDITIGPLIDLWGFNKPYRLKTLPEQIEIDKVLHNIGFDKISLKDNILNKTNENIQIDLNSIAKGYAVDRVSEFIKENGYNDYLVEIGGEVRASSKKYKNNWIIGIQHPESNNLINKVKINNLSMATSGTYNNYFDYNGISYSHIINPKTGFPFKSKTVSATIFSKNCIDSDAYATISMTVEPETVIDLTNANNDVEAYLIEIDHNGELIEYKSKGFEALIYK